MAAGHAVSIDRRETRNGYQTSFWYHRLFSRKTNQMFNPPPVRALPTASGSAAGIKSSAVGTH